jgi:hypothetical protein
MRIEVVLTAIDLNDEPVLHTDKIDNVPVPRRLTAEMKATLFPRAEMNPKLHLLGCHGFSQTTRELICHADHHPARFARHPPPFGEGKTRSTASNHEAV